MPVTKKVKPTKEQEAQLKVRIVTDEDEEDIAQHKPEKARVRERDIEREAKIDREEERAKNLERLLIRLGSLAPDDLKQLTFISMKIRDPLAKGMAYYDSTLLTIEKQCSELMDWYIKQCELDIEKCKIYIEAIKNEAQELETAKKELGIVANTILDNAKNSTATKEKMNDLSKDMERLESRVSQLSKKPATQAVLRKKSFWDKIFGSPKVRVTPELEAFNANQQLIMLETRLVELNKDKKEVALIVEARNMYFKKWAYEYMLLCRSQQGEGNFLNSLVMLTDGQIVNKQDSGGLDMSSVFKR